MLSLPALKSTFAFHSANAMQLPLPTAQGVGGIVQQLKSCTGLRGTAIASGTICFTYSISCSCGNRVSPLIHCSKGGFGMCLVCTFLHKLSVA